jgi:tungstate transport system ATP-binding protein
MRADICDFPISLDAAGFTLGATQVLAPLTLTIYQGAPTVVIGPNGAGKTTLLKLAMGLIAPTSGAVTYGGRKDSDTRNRAFVLQRPVMLRRSVAGNVQFALAAAGRPAGPDQVRKLLVQVGLDGLGDRPARRLSGGEQQRLAIARALGRNAQVLFLDEPTASLDPASTKVIEDIVTAAASAGVKIVMSTHDLGQARRLAGEIIFLVRGRLVERASASRFFAEPGTTEARQFLAGDLVI